MLQKHYISQVYNPNPEPVKMFLRPFPPPPGDMKAKIMGEQIYEEHGLSIELKKSGDSKSVSAIKFNIPCITLFHRYKLPHKCPGASFVNINKL